jgi:very-short-patch-repair endonuclease
LRERVGERGMKGIIRQRALDLRRNSTDAERKLWHHLRAKRLSGLKFKRQEPIGNYIVDFVCHERKVIIELDGGQHAELAVRDMVRESWLQSRGFRTLRIWNSDVFTNMDGVLQMIMDFCFRDRED